MELVYNSPQWREERDAMLIQHVGDRHAIAFLKALFTVAEVWDDLIDGDKVVAIEAVNEAFMIALVAIPSNPFFVTYREQLLPLVITGINTWQDSNKLQHGNLTDRALAYVLRDWHCEIAAFVVFLLHGPVAMQQFSSNFRHFHMRHEPFEAYIGAQP